MTHDIGLSRGQTISRFKVLLISYIRYISGTKIHPPLLFHENIPYSLRANLEKTKILSFEPNLDVTDRINC